MIHIFFVPGMFGSTLEYVLRSHVAEFSPITGAKILEDGSMHSFHKEFHPGNIENIASRPDKFDISTPIYPFGDQHLDEILAAYNKIISDSDKFIIVYASDIGAAELNMLFQYRKIATGSLNLSIDIFCGNNQHNIVNWNKDYKSWRDMQLWELREWLSMFYPTWINEWINSPSLVDSKFLPITNVALLSRPAETWRQIMAHCDLTENLPVETFAAEWRQAQQYIVDEFELINSIVDSTINQNKFSWESVSIISEAIIQKRLRDAGYEIKCYNLNKFPTNTKTLYSLLEKV